MIAYHPSPHPPLPSLACVQSVFASGSLSGGKHKCHLNRQRIDSLATQYPPPSPAALCPAAVTSAISCHHQHQHQHNHHNFARYYWQRTVTPTSIFLCGCELSSIDSRPLLLLLPASSNTTFTTVLRARGVGVEGDEEGSVSVMLVV